jgi:putative intracellular protease/amidase
MQFISFDNKFHKVMKKLIFLFFLMSFLISGKKEPSKVLLYIEDSSELQYMLIHEVNRMSELLKQTGFEVRTATLTGEILKTDSVTMKPDLKLNEVDIKDYAGFIMPCMAPGDTTVTSEEINFAKNIVKEGKPVAAQLGAVLILGKAGVLKGKKYAWADEQDENVNMFPALSDGIYSGRGVVRDGLIITSGTCPMMAKMRGHQDGTDELTRTLIEVIKEQTR